MLIQCMRNNYVGDDMVENGLDQKVEPDQPPFFQYDVKEATVEG